MGTGKPDGHALRQVADLLVSVPGLKPTTAIKRVIGVQNPSDVRRLQVKWKVAGPVFLDEARRRDELCRRVGDIPQLLGFTTEMSTTAASMLARSINTPEMQAIMKHAAETTAVLARSINTPEMQTMRKCAVEITAMMERVNRPLTTAASVLARSINTPEMQAMMKHAAEIRAVLERATGPVGGIASALAEYRLSRP